MEIRLRRSKLAMQPSPDVGAATPDTSPHLASASIEHIARFVAEDMAGLIGYWTRDLVCAFANRAYADWLGHSPETLRGCRLPDRFPAIYEKNRELVAAVLAGKPQRFEQTLTRIDGRSFVLWTQYVPDIVDGVVAGFVVLGTDLTAMRRAEAAHRQSEARFSSAFLDAPIGMAIVGLDGRWLQVNQAVCDLLGYDERELRTRTFQEITHPDDLAANLCLLQRLLAGELPRYQIEKRYLHRSGATVHTLLGVSLIRDENGAPDYCLSQIVDLTARRRSEARDATRRDAMTLIATGAPLETVLTTIVRGIEAEVAGSLCSVLLLDATRQRLRLGAAPSLPAWYNEAIDGVEIGPCVGSCGTAAYTGEMVIVGDIATSPLWVGWRDLAARAQLVSCWSYPIRDRQGDVLGTFAMYSKNVHLPSEDDETTIRVTADLASVAIERRRAEEATIASQKRYEDLVQSVQGIVWEADATTLEFSFVSAEAERLLGYPRAMWLEDPTFWESHLHPDDHEHALRFCRAATAAGLGHRFEYRMRTADGRYLWLEDTVSVIAVSDGRTLLRGVLIDITDRKAAEARIHELNATLELRIHERTAQLSASNGELRAFSYAVSHDLRAPLRRLEAWSTALAEESGPLLDERGHHHLGRIQSEAKLMGGLIDDLLRLSRVTQSELLRRVVDLTALARTIVARLAEAHPERAVTLTVAPSMTAEADPGLIGAALTNLLENAWKFTSLRSLAHIEVGHYEREGQTIFYVKDDGAGFDPRYADSLFRPFRRLHKTSEFPGSGIGLATVQRVITRHGGEVWAEGVEGHGATVFFTLPPPPEPAPARDSALPGVLLR
jgi:PAS domain S-box-containing protein